MPGRDLATLALPLEAVVDQFGYGYPEPAAIQALMAYAAEAWDPAPRYLLLVGDASYDPRGYLTPPEANRLPTFLVQTVHGGETASDLPFGELDDDPWPEIAVGRLPARTADQVAVIVEKILAYEAQRGSGADWQKRVLAVADGQSAQFRQDAQTFLDQFSGSYETELFAPEAGVEGAGAQVRAQIEAGAALVAYFGHGSVTQWGKDDLFTVEDIAGLGNGDRLPVVVNMTCLTGLFTHPEVNSLAETLLWEPGGGAVAVLAPTSLTLPWDQGFLSAALVDGVGGRSRGAAGGHHGCGPPGRIPGDRRRPGCAADVFVVWGPGFAAGGGWGVIAHAGRQSCMSSGLSSLASGQC